ncbi:MAG: tRNA uridine-5-carboxymethylaminomethyl(34) synthesis GTPase MnmE [Rhodospirillaceae bacterium]|nr:tRNA uridine-5-carboxymethylaminomethyl(34) synthesis GTPase MnmE [Rhodospirillaceae bacterium]
MAGGAGRDGVSHTVFAVSSGAMPAGVAVVRVSGRSARSAIAALAPPLPEPRRAVLRPIGPAGDAIDRGLVLWFPGPHSATGEDVAEFHVHGGRAVVGDLLEALGRLADLRPAEPGEFTRRAVLNGRMDLTEAEAVADMVAAETAMQRRQALRQMGGALRTRYDGWRTRLLAALAHLEADLDFPDEDLPAGIAAAVAPEVAALAEEITRHLDDGGAAERVRSGVAVAILGPPNAGKSSILNKLARRPAAIVSHIAGTTRDVVEVHLDLAGLAVTLWDTAGLRDDGGDEIEAEGIRRSLERAETADLRLVVLDGAGWPDVPAATAGVLASADLAVWNKADLRGAGSPGGDPPAESKVEPMAGGVPALWVSALTGAGLAELEAALAERAGGLAALAAGLGPTRTRHRAALQDTKAALVRALATAEPELAAEDLRVAATALGRITGRIDVEDLLDVVFRDFCIGK